MRNVILGFVTTTAFFFTGCGPEESLEAEDATDEVATVTQGLATSISCTYAMKTYSAAVAAQIFPNDVVGATITSPTKTGRVYDIWVAQENPQKTIDAKRGVGPGVQLKYNVAIPKTRRPYVGFSVLNDFGTVLCKNYYHF
jgi:hypothetical protein